MKKLLLALLLTISAFNIYAADPIYNYEDLSITEDYSARKAIVDTINTSDFTCRLEDEEELPMSTYPIIQLFLTRQFSNAKQQTLFQEDLT